MPSATSTTTASSTLPIQDFFCRKAKSAALMRASLSDPATESQPDSSVAGWTYRTRLLALGGFEGKVPRGLEDAWGLEAGLPVGGVEWRD